MLSETAVFFILSAFLVGQAEAVCYERAADECLKLFWNTAFFMTRDSFSLTSVNETKLDSVCPIVSEIESCVRRAGCFPDSQLLLKAWAGVKDANKYVCNDGKQAFVRNIDCLNAFEIMWSSDDCRKHLKQATIFNYCGVTSKFFNCTREAVLKCGEYGLCVYTIAMRTHKPLEAVLKCSEERHRVYTTVVRKLFKPIAPFYGCQLDQAETNCNESAVVDCLKAISLPNKTDYDNITEPVLNAMCSIIPAVESCVRSADCVPDSQLILKAWAGLTDAHKYVCNKGKQAFLRNINCLKSDKVLRAVRPCDKQFFREATRFNYCNVANDLFNCTSEVALLCGEEGQRVFTTIVYKLYKPIAPFFGCQLVRLINQPTNRTNLIEQPTQQPTDRPTQQLSHRPSDRLTNRRNDRPT